MTTQIQFAEYFGDIYALTSIPNDIMGIILSFLDPSAVSTIKKLNQLLNTMSNEEYHYLIKNEADPRYLYNPLINYRDSKVDYFVLKEICWIVTHMPLLYETDNRKSTLVKQIGLNQGQKHHIEHIHNFGFSNIPKMTILKLPNKQRIVVSSYLKCSNKSHYISRSATLLSFMVCGFQKNNYTFKCKQVRLTRKIILQYAYMFEQLFL
jgi:hypothetical protein